MPAKANNKVNPRGKAKAKASPEPGGPVTHVNLGASQEAYMSLLIRSITHLKSLDALSDIVTSNPLPLTEGGGQSSFCAASLAKALAGPSRRYFCGGNLWWLDPIVNLTPGVPKYSEACRLLIKAYFASGPAPYPDLVTVALLPHEEVCVTSLKGSLSCVSPDELVHAMLIASSEDLAAWGDDLDRVNVWRHHFLTVPFEFTRTASVKLRYYMAEQKRQNIGQNFASMKRLAVQQMYVTMTWRSEYAPNLKVSDLVIEWNSNVRMAQNSEEFSESYFDACCTVWDRLMVHVTLRDKILLMEEEFVCDPDGGPWKSIYRLEALVKKCGKRGQDSTLENLTWSVMGLHDRLRNKAILPSDCNVRALSGKGQPSNKGLVDFLLYQLSVKKHAEQVLLPSLGLAAEVITEVKALLSCHAVYRDKFGFAHTMIPRQFLLGFPPPVGKLILCMAEALYEEIYFGVVKFCTRNGYGAADFFERGEVKLDWDQITKDLRVTQHQREDPNTGHNSLATEQVAEHCIAIGKLLEPSNTDLSSAVKSVVDEQKQLCKQIHDLEERNLMVVLSFENKAMRQTRDKIWLLVEPKSMLTLASDIRESYCGKVQGSAKKPVLVVYDVKAQGESLTHPHLRKPPFKFERFKKIVKATVINEAGNFRDDVHVLYLDGGAHGNKTVALNQIQGEDGKGLTFHKKEDHIIWQEEALSDKFGRVSQTTEYDQLETMVSVRAAARQYEKKNRLHFDGTTQGNLIGPLRAPNATDTWFCSFREKKLMMGSMRQPVGGSDADSNTSDAKRKRDDSDVEPFNFHCMPLKFGDEIVHSFEPSAMIDCCVDGMLAKTCLMDPKNIPYLGICFTEEHMNGLYDHLANYLFKCYMTDSHDLYEPDLAKALKSSSVSGEVRSESAAAASSITTGSGAADGVAAPKAKARKRKNPEASSGAAGGGAAGSFMCDVSFHVCCFHAYWFHVYCASPLSISFHV